ncbi:MAG: hypothetical protein PF904_05820 [Kiritimatiellae bacterium]|nr:hypothetical protein [Kiritimatiellia bacterium]
MKDPQGAPAINAEDFSGVQKTMFYPPHSGGYTILHPVCSPVSGGRKR